MDWLPLVYFIFCLWWNPNLRVRVLKLKF
uniref:Uncharacterized protein n=1 Tax=Rhizophora mucronata TaxID=61149 RepID=A0A2P2QCJ9_RHIMU